MPEAGLALRARARAQPHACLLPPSLAQGRSTCAHALLRMHPRPAPPGPRAVGRGAPGGSLLQQLAELLAQRGALLARRAQLAPGRVQALLQVQARRLRLRLRVRLPPRARDA